MQNMVGFGLVWLYVVGTTVTHGIQPETHTYVLLSKTQQPFTPILAIGETSSISEVEIRSCNKGGFSSKASVPPPEPR